MKIKEILVQYADLVQEAKELRQRIEKLEDDMNKIASGEKSVVDVVWGTTNDIRHAPCLITIRGVASEDYYEKKLLLKEYQAKLERLEQNVLKQLMMAQEYIEGIEDSRMRRIFTYRYVDGLRWFQVAQRIGGRCTADSVRVEHDRFFEEQ